MTTQADIARRMGVSVSTVNKILNRKLLGRFREDTVRRVWQLARDLGYPLEKLSPTTHRRRYERTVVRIPATVTFHVPWARKATGTATAVIQDLSIAGARVGMIETRDGLLPARPFKVRIRPSEGPLTGLEIRARVVRIFLDANTLAMGVTFEKPRNAVLRRLRRVIAGSEKGPGSTS